MDAPVAEFENQWKVETTRSHTSFHGAPVTLMTNDEALVLAAYLVMKAEPYAELTFVEVQREVRHAVLRGHQA